MQEAPVRARCSSLFHHKDQTTIMAVVEVKEIQASLTDGCLNVLRKESHQEDPGTGNHALGGGKAERTGHV